MQTRHFFGALPLLLVALVTTRAHAEDGDLPPTTGPRVAFTTFFALASPSLANTSFHGLVEQNGVPTEVAYKGSELGLAHPTTYGLGLSLHYAPFPNTLWFSFFADGGISSGRVDAAPTNPSAFNSVVYDPSRSANKSAFVVAGAMGPELQFITGSAIFRVGIGLGGQSVSIGEVHASTLFLQARMNLDFIVIGTSSGFGTSGQKPTDDRAVTLGIFGSTNTTVANGATGWMVGIGPGFSFW